MAELLSGGAVGAVTGEVLKYALQTIQNGLEFGPTLEMNVETLNALAPLVEQIKDYSDLLGRPREEIERFETHITEGNELVRKSKKLTLWKFFRFPHFQTKLKKKDEALLRHLNVNVQVENRRDLMEVLAYVKVILKIIMIKENLVGGAQIWGLSGNQIWGLFGAPQEPGLCLGMDEPLNNLKIELIKDGVSVHVLTGLGGIGKSTLAKKLCWDSQIKGKFCGNIFYVTLTRFPSLKHIVQTLFKHCGLRVPEFHNDEDAFNRLRFLLSQVGRNPILLVLDDVWAGSERLVESLLEMLKFQMLDCKILVTSREVAFTRFGTPCQLYPLQHDHAVSLFLHFAQLNRSSSYMPYKDLVHEIVKGCRGSPLGLQVVAGSLIQQPFEKWQYAKERLMSPPILGRSSSFDSKIATETDMYFNNLNVAMHGLHGELAIHQSKREPFEQRKRTFQTKKKMKQRKRQIIDLNARVKKTDALQISINMLVGVIVALSCVVMLLLFLVVIF